MSSRGASHGSGRTSGKDPGRDPRGERHPGGWRIRPGPDGRGTPPPEARGFGRGLLLFLVTLLLVNFLIAALIQGPAATRVRIPYSPTFLAQVSAGNVSSISSKGTTVQGNFRSEVRYPNAKASPAKLFVTELPAFAENKALLRLLQEKGVVINAKAPSSGTPLVLTLLLSFGPALLIVGLFMWLMSRAAGGIGGGISAFGRSRAQRVEPSQQHLTFEDVAGIDEAKAELSELVDFLRDPEKYRRLGGRIPRGVLLTGAPGTGKTLLARALAGEAQVPFFSISASEFVELFVGVGASRVRDLFTQAKQAAPAIIFIDELDAIGRSRAGAIGGFGRGHDEREQTLNQILTEMDGFDPSVGVIVISATNRPEVLDPALLRPGRFDRRVAVQPPDRNGREQILEVHTRGVPIGSDVDLGRIASTTPGMVGADLANLVNEAALLAARRGHEKVLEADFTDALERIVHGAERKVMMSAEDRRRTAYHEGGHALVGMLTPGADPVRKISIIPRGLALGVTFSAPDADRYNYERDELIAKIKVALGGRAAEEMVYGQPSTGAESDIQQLTQIARQMVGRWGMSVSIGPLAVLPADGSGPLLPGASEVSMRTQEAIDEEVRRIVDDAHRDVLTLLAEHRAQLDSLAAALVEHETLDEDDAYAAAGVDHRASVDAEQLAASAAVAAATDR